MNLLHKCVRFAITSIICISLIWGIRIFGTLVGLDASQITEIRWGIITVWMWLTKQWTNRAGKSLYRNQRRPPNDKDCL